MSSITIRYKAKFGKQPQAKPEKPKSSLVPSRVARMLALAYYIELAIEAGDLKGYVDVARKLGMSRARVTQVMNLLNLSPKNQADILLGRVEVSERRLRGALREVEWGRQRLDG